MSTEKKIVSPEIAKEVSSHLKAVCELMDSHVEFLKDQTGEVRGVIIISNSIKNAEDLILVNDPEIALYPKKETLN